MAIWIDHIQYRTTMKEKHRTGFLSADLHRYFEQYCIEKFVRRFLRTHGIDTVEDLVDLEEADLETFLDKKSASQKVRERSLYLYRKLRISLDKIIAAGTPKKQPERIQRSDRTEESMSVPEHVKADTELLQSTPERETDEDVKGERLEAGKSEEFVLRVPPSQPRLDFTSRADSISSPIASELDVGHPKSKQPGDKTESPTASEDLPPIYLGPIIQRDKFGREKLGGGQQIPFDENGLRRHVLIAGTTGSGKTVAARFVIEQAALRGVPSIVIDAQGDISSLVFQDPKPSSSTLYEKITAVQRQETPKDTQDIKGKIEQHLEALEKLPMVLADIPELYTKHCLPRIFTPGWQDLGLPLAFPMYIDILAKRDGDLEDRFSKQYINELLEDEISNLVHIIIPRAKQEIADGYVELLTKLFRYAHKQNIPLDGLRGITNLHELVKKAPEIESEIFENFLSKKDHENLIKAVFRLTFGAFKKWLTGYQFDVEMLTKNSADGRTPINIINVKDLRVEDKRRVLRHVIAGVYKFALQNPRHSGPPSLILYIDEIGSGYGERSVAKPQKGTEHRVYEVLSQLVRQARKYGVSVMLASQAYTDFYPDLRRQLGTKIIGKVDDSSEQKRVATSVSADFERLSSYPIDFIRQELPQLAPPLLLYIDVRGRAKKYKQFKCCTIDIILGERDIRQWRDLYENRIRSSIEQAEALINDHHFQTSLELINSIVDQADFFSDLRPKIARCCVNLGDLLCAERLFNSLEDEDASPEWIEIGQQLATSYKDQQKSDQYVSVLLKTLRVAKLINSPKYEQLQLELVKHRLFVEANPEAASEILSAISNSDNPRISLFGKIWSQVLRLFPSVKSIWRFFAQADKRETKVVVQGKELFSILVTKLPRDESCAEKPVSFISELATKPEIMKISKLSSEKKKPTLSFYEFRAIQRHQKEVFDQAATCRKQGRISTMIEALEKYFTEYPQIAIDDTMRAEIAFYDRDPEIRKVRVGDWIQKLSWRDFELEVSQLFVRMGYHTQATKPSGDGGVDIWAVKGQETAVIQCKHWKQQKVGLETVQALSAVKISEGASHAILVTSSFLEPGAKKWAYQNEVDVIEGPQLVELCITHCDPERQDKDVNRPLRSEDHASQQIHDDAKEQRIDPSGLTPKDRQVLDLLRSKAEIRNQDVQVLLGVSRPAAWTRLKRLVDKGYLTMHNTKSLAFYTKKKDIS